MTSKKKKILGFCLALTLSAGGVLSAYAASASCSISKGTGWAESASIGINDRAYFFGENYASSTERLTMHAYCAWTGWPYTLENSVSITPGGNNGFTEVQSRNSVFYVALQSTGGCNGRANVTY